MKRMIFYCPRIHLRMNYHGTGHPKRSSFASISNILCWHKTRQICTAETHKGVRDTPPTPPPLHHPHGLVFRGMTRRVRRTSWFNPFILICGQQQQKKIDNLEMRQLFTRNTQSAITRLPLRKNIVTTRRERRVAAPSHTLTAKKTPKNLR